MKQLILEYSKDENGALYTGTVKNTPVVVQALTLTALHAKAVKVLTGWVAQLTLALGPWQEGPVKLLVVPAPEAKSPEEKKPWEPKNSETIWAKILDVWIKAIYVGKDIKDPYHVVRSVEGSQVLRSVEHIHPLSADPNNSKKEEKPVGESAALWRHRYEGVRSQLKLAREGSAELVKKIDSLQKECNIKRGEAARDLERATERIKRLVWELATEKFHTRALEARIAMLTEHSL